MALGVCAHLPFVKLQLADELAPEGERHVQVGADRLCHGQRKPLGIFANVGHHYGLELFLILVDSQGARKHHALQVVLPSIEPPNGQEAGFGCCSRGDGRPVGGNHRLRPFQDDVQDLVQVQGGVHHAGDLGHGHGQFSLLLLLLVKLRVPDGHGSLERQAHAQVDLLWGEAVGFAYDLQLEESQRLVSDDEGRHRVGAKVPLRGRG